LKETKLMEVNYLRNNASEKVNIFNINRFKELANIFLDFFRSL